MFVSTAAKLLAVSVLSSPAPTVADPTTAGHTVVPADWVKTPSGADLNAVWPERALAQGVSGSATLHCRVTVQGLATACKVVAETPEGFGFGSAALLLTPSFVFKPETVDGVPTTGSVTIPINFKTPGRAPGGPTAVVLPWIPWVSAPTWSEVRQAYPPNIKGSVYGHVVLRCSLQADGRLADCKFGTVQPEGRGFERAALKVSSFFKAAPDILKRIKLKSTLVVVPIHFPPPSSATDAPHYISEPDWLTQIDPGDDPIFPVEAAKAGVHRGRAVVDCGIGPTGALTACMVRSEEPSSLGIGAAAVRVAQALSVNLWTRDGFPTAGSRISLPLKLVDEKATAPTGSPGPTPAVGAR